MVPQGTLGESQSPGVDVFLAHLISTFGAILKVWQHICIHRTPIGRICGQQELVVKALPVFVIDGAQEADLLILVVEVIVMDPYIKLGLLLIVRIYLIR